MFKRFKKTIKIDPFANVDLSVLDKLNDELKETTRSLQQQATEAVMNIRENEKQRFAREIFSFTQQISDGVLITSSDDEILFINNALESMLKYSMSMCLGKKLTDYMDKVTSANFSSLAELSTHEIYKVKLLDIHKNIIETEITVSLFFGKDNESYFIVIIRDISKRVEHEKIIETAFENMNEAQRIAKVGNWEWDIVKNTVSWSDMIYNIFNIDKKTKLNYELFLSVVHPDDKKMVQGAVDKALTGEKYNTQHRVIINNEIKIVHEVGEVEFRNNKPVMMRGTVQDITEHVEVERKTREREIILRTFLEQSFDGVWIIEDNKIIFANQHCCDMFGYNKSDLVDKLSLYDLVHSDSKEEVKYNFEGCLNGEPRPANYTFKGITKNEHEIWANLSSVVMTFKSGNDNRKWTFGTLRDVTQQTILDKTVKQEHDFFKSLFESNVLGVVILNQDGIFVNVNKIAANIYGYNKSDLIGNSFVYTLPEHKRSEAYESFKQSVGTNDTSKKMWSITNNTTNEITKVIASGKNITTNNEILRVITMIDAEDIHSKIKKHCKH